METSWAVSPTLIASGTMGAVPQIFTIGYEGITLEAFVETLREHGVQTVVDVRELPLSRRAGFSKRPLSAVLKENGIGYVHERPLGTPKALRHALRAGLELESFRAEYRQVLADRQPDLERVAALAAHERVALMCFEADPLECHRSVIADELLRLGLISVFKNLAPKKRSGAET